MGKHEGQAALRAARTPRARRRSHPETLAVGLLVVLALLTAAGFAIRSLYSDYQWHSSALSASTEVARAIQNASARDDSPPVPVDAVPAGPGPGQVTVNTLAYAAEIPADVTRIRLGAGGGLSVTMRSGALCSGVTFDMSSSDDTPTGSFACGDNLPPLVPPGLAATAHDASVSLSWQPSPGPIEDYEVAYSPDDGASWHVVDDGVSSGSRASVRSLLNGHSYLFRITAVNLAGRSAGTTAAASPYTRPGPPTGVRAVGGFTAVVSWRPPTQDGGRPVSSYLVEGQPTGICTAAAPATSCEISDLPAAPKYTFTVRAVNDAGPGAVSTDASEPVAVYSVPGRPVAVTADPGDGVVLLTWTAPLLDGNTPILDYRVEYKPVPDATWTVVEHAPSPGTARAVSGLVNGTEYDFRVLAVNAAGLSDPPLSGTRETPATVPGPPQTLTETDADRSILLTWSPPAFDGGVAITDHEIQYTVKGGHWTTFNHEAAATSPFAVTGLTNGTSYALRVASINAMGRGAWSSLVKGNPFGPPGPVTIPTAVGSRTSIGLSWQPPADDGGRDITGYRVQYKSSADPNWTPAARVPARRHTATVTGLTAGQSYDFRIVAVSAAGAGPSGADGLSGPTLAGVIADETPPPPSGLTARPADGRVTLTWRASAAGPQSPIASYVVTGTPAGACATIELTCVITGLTNDVAYSFTVAAANASLTGPASKPVTTRPHAPFNEATGGTVTTYRRGGRAFRVHTFTTSATFVVTAGSRPFDVLIVGGGGGSIVSPDGTVSPGGGGQTVAAYRSMLPTGPVAVVVGAGGGPGIAGAGSSVAPAGTASAGAAGPAASAPAWPATTSAITGSSARYGGVGTATSGEGVDGRGSGAGGPGSSRGGNGVVIIRYEIEP